MNSFLIIDFNIITKKPYSTILAGELPTAYLFKGIYGNDCVQLLVDFNII
jgi:hypothetical protein